MLRPEKPNEILLWHTDKCTACNTIITAKGFMGSREALKIKRDSNTHGKLCVPIAMGTIASTMRDEGTS